MSSLISSREGAFRLNRPASSPPSFGRSSAAIPPALTKPLARDWAAGERRFSVLLFAAVFAASYLFSLWYLEAYYAGDLAHYRAFYEAVRTTSPGHWADMQRFYLGSSEPAYRWLIGMAAHYSIDQTKLMSVSNGFVCALLSVILRRYRSSLIFALLAFSNLYFLVLVGPAERLKFAYFMFLLAIVIQDVKWRGALSLLSIFFHTQALIQLISGSIFYVVSNRHAIFITPLRTIIGLALGLSIGAACIYYFIAIVWSDIVSKAARYSSRSEGWIEILPWALLFAVGTYLFRPRLAYIAAMVPLGMLTFMYGNRINICTLALFAFLAVTQQKSNNVFVLCIMGFLTFKSIGYLQNIMAYGTGFV